MQLQLTKLGAKPKTLLANVHAMMSHNLSKEDVIVRTGYYNHIITEVFAINTEVIVGSDFQYKEPYVALLYKAMQHFSIGQSKQASLAVKKNKRDTIDRYVYPLMQCIDAAFLCPDIIVAERGQEKIYRLMKSMTEASNFDSLHAWLSSVHIIYVDSAHDLQGKRMQNSSRSTRISYHDAVDVVREKVKKMFAPPELKEQNKRRNAVLESFEYSLYPFQSRIDGLNLPFTTYSDLEEAYLAGDYHPVDAKKDLSESLLRRKSWFDNRLKKDQVAWIDPSFYGG